MVTGIDNYKKVTFIKVWKSYGASYLSPKREYKRYLIEPPYQIYNAILETLFLSKCGR